MGESEANAIVQHKFEGWRTRETVTELSLSGALASGAPVCKDGRQMFQLRMREQASSLIFFYLFFSISELDGASLHWSREVAYLLTR